jgi:hypothetical protein
VNPHELPPHAVWDGDLTTVHPRVDRVEDVIAAAPKDRRNAVAALLTSIQDQIRPTSRSGGNPPATVAVAWYLKLVER